MAIVWKPSEEYLSRANVTRFMRAHDIDTYEHLVRRSVEDIARMVRETLADPAIELEYVPSDDLRSYHVNSDKVKRVLGFETRHTIEDAIRDIADAYRRGLIHDPLKNPLYSNIKRMQLLKVK